jgi:transposase
VDLEARKHPEVEVICRDRAGGYGEGARDGAPQAIQVADRFHLWKNLGEAVEKTGNEHRARLVEPSPEAAASSEPPPVVEPLPEKKTVKRLGNNYADVHKLRSQGLSKAAIGRKLGLHPATVRKFCNARSVDNLIAKTEQRAHIVDAYTGYLHRRWNEGERNATKLFREIVELAYKGGELAVQRNLRRYREGRGHAPRTGPKPPSIREATSWIMRHPDNLSSDAATAL